MKCYYHNDLDGRCAASIVTFKNPTCEFIGVDYKDKIDIGRIKENEKIYIVDFSFKPEVMEKVLKKTNNIIWLDHHKTAMEYEYSVELYGLRNVEYAGCELTWIWFYHNQQMPMHIRLIGDHDKWANKYPESNIFCMGMQFYPHQPRDSIWSFLISKPEKYRTEIIEKGNICLQFRDNFCADYIKNYSFEIKFEGYNCLVNGIYRFGSLAFGDNISKYDICISYVFDGQNWTIGLYSKTVDVSVIAKKYGGGGHTGAAGFVSNTPPWEIKE